MNDLEVLNYTYEKKILNSVFLSSYSQQPNKKLILFFNQSMHYFFGSSLFFIFFFFDLISNLFKSRSEALTMIPLSGGDTEYRTSLSEREPCTIKKSKTGLVQSEHIGDFIFNF